jgi:hypothetical protein
VRCAPPPRTRGDDGDAGGWAVKVALCAPLPSLRSVTAPPSGVGCLSVPGRGSVIGPLGSGPNWPSGSPCHLSRVEAKQNVAEEQAMGNFHDAIQTRSV